MPASQQRSAADYRWLTLCPDLLRSPLSLPLESSTVSRSKIDFTAADRFRASQGGHRVGGYVESLVLSALESSDTIRDIQQGIQIREGNETRGELDFLYREDGLLIHLEVAIKLFLYSPAHTLGGSHFIGPNAADTFERKRDKILQKQVPFGKACFPEIDESRVLVKGMIFYHPNDDPLPDELPETLNPEHQRGSWIHDYEMEDFFQSHSSLTPVIMEKPFWLACPDFPDSQPDREELIDTIRIKADDRGAAILVSLVEETGEGVRESDRVFVVPRSWPMGS